MSTENHYYEKGPLGQRYIIHPLDKDEVCLHALTTLQADLIHCFLPVYYNHSENHLIVDITGCVPLSEVKGKQKQFIQAHYRKLLTGFLTDMIQSLNHALPLSGICCLEEHLYFNQFSQKLVCIYLPLKSKLTGHSAQLSDFDENALDELLHLALDRKWIRSEATEELYRLFRNDDENGSIAFLSERFWVLSRKFPRSILRIVVTYVLFLLTFILCSTAIENVFYENAFRFLPWILFALSSGSTLAALCHFSKKNLHLKNTLVSSKEQRRKTRNAQLLFPQQECKSEWEDPSSGLLIHPVLFEEITAGSNQNHDGKRFTFWTNEFVIGEDATLCDYCIEHKHLSLRHALLMKDASGIYVQDLNSQSGTFVNRRRLQKNEKVYLEDGDILGLGDVEFRARYVHGIV